MLTHGESKVQPSVGRMKLADIPCNVRAADGTSARKAAGLVGLPDLELGDHGPLVSDPRY